MPRPSSVSAGQRGRLTGAVAISDHLEEGFSGVIDSDINAGLGSGTGATL